MLSKKCQQLKDKIHLCVRSGGHLLGSKWGKLHRTEIYLSCRITGTTMVRYFLSSEILSGDGMGAALMSEYHAVGH